MRRKMDAWSSCRVSTQRELRYVGWAGLGMCGNDARWESGVVLKESAVILEWDYATATLLVYKLIGKMTWAEVVRLFTSAGPAKDSVSAFVAVAKKPLKGLYINLDYIDTR